MRLFILCVLIGVFGTYSYIYLRISLQQYTFWALSCTLLAEIFLFVGSGKQMVYQKLVNTTKIDYKDNKKKSNIWMTGVFFYTMAWPMVMVSNFLFFVNMAAVSSKLSDKMKTKAPFLDITNESIRVDVKTQIEIRFQKEYTSKLNTDIDDFSNWRNDVVLLANILPLVCLLLDFIMNKIKMKLRHFWFVIIINACYLLVTLFAQYNHRSPIYIDNLNWFCNYNLSYLYNKKTMKIEDSMRSTPCG